MKEKRFLDFETIEYSTSEKLDNSLLFKHKIDIKKTIYISPNSEFVIKKKINNSSRTTPKKSVLIKQRTNFNSFLTENFLSVRRKSRSIDLVNSSFLKNEFYFGRVSKKSKKQENNKFILKLTKIFFLFNFFNPEQEFNSELDFVKYFKDFYYEVQTNINQFKVNSY